MFAVETETGDVVNVYDVRILTGTDGGIRVDGRVRVMFLIYSAGEWIYAPAELFKPCQESVPLEQ